MSITGTNTPDSTTLVLFQSRVGRSRAPLIFGTPLLLEGPCLCDLCLQVVALGIDVYCLDYSSFSWP